MGEAAVATIAWLIGFSFVAVKRVVMAMVAEV
jgi:hypothetical protein